ncbi:AMP-binding protein [Cupriavidus basilensis]
MLFSIGEFLGVDYPGMLQRVCAAGLAPSHHPARGARRRLVLAGLPGLAEDTPSAMLDARVAALTPDSPSDLLYTSGTTGRPKGVITTHGQNLRTFSDWSGIVGLRADDRYLIVNPFFHAFGYKAGWLAALLRGATILTAGAA